MAGTKDFARCIEHYAIAMAYVSSGWIQIETIYTVEANELYLARRGNGTTRSGQRSGVQSRRKVPVWKLAGQTSCPTGLMLTRSRPRLRPGSMCAVCRQGVLGLAFVEGGYAELDIDAGDFLAGLLIFEETGGLV